MDKTQWIEWIRQKFEAVRDVLHERGCRVWAAAEARHIGWGGESIVEQATGITRKTIRRGLREIEENSSDALAPYRSRLPGGGRKRTETIDSDIRQELDALVDPVTRGDPESPLRWTCKSIRKLAEELKHRKINVCPNVVRDLLHEMGYSLQANRKTREGVDHPDRKVALRELANDLQLDITVCHFPPGTSKWNKIVHRLFSFITQNWRGHPLYDLVTVVSLISNTSTSQGLLVKFAVDTKNYPKGIEVTDAKPNTVGVKKHDFYGDWNDTIEKQKIG